MPSSEPALKVKGRLEDTTAAMSSELPQNGRTPHPENPRPQGNRPMGDQSPGHRVYVIDDDPAVRDSIALLVSGEGYRVEPCASLTQFEEVFTPSEEPTCLVLDVKLPGTDGIQIQEGLRSTQPQLPIVFISGHADVPTTVKAFRKGAVHFLEKPYREEDLLKAIGEALTQCQANHERADARQRLSSLTGRESEILDLIVDGMSTKEIAAEIFRSAKTIEAHRRSIMRKLDVSNLAEMVRIAMSAR